jgi:hypothetical protein
MNFGAAIIPKTDDPITSMSVLKLPLINAGEDVWADAKRFSRD